MDAPCANEIYVWYDSYGRTGKGWDIRPHAGAR